MAHRIPPVSIELPPHHLEPLVAGFAHWLLTHRGAVRMGGMLAFAGPLMFFTGALSVMRAPTPGNLARLGFWWMLYGISLWGLLLVAGYGCERLAREFGRYLTGAILLLAGCAAAALASLVTAGREDVLIELGLVHSGRTMHLHGFIFSLVLALLYFAHLRRSREHEQAAARLAAAQTAQRDARRCIVQARLQEVQARIDPQMLFELLESVRCLSERDPARAERFIDELIAFLRAALPRLRTPWSSLLREVELARALMSLRGLLAADGPSGAGIGGAGRLAMTVDIALDIMHARFPPGVLLPLLDAASASGRRCKLNARRSADDCQLVLELGAPPSQTSVTRVGSLLTELYGTGASLEIQSMDGAVDVIVTIPYEPA